MRHVPVGTMRSDLRISLRIVPYAWVAVAAPNQLSTGADALLGGRRGATKAER